MRTYKSILRLKALLLGVFLLPALCLAGGAPLQVQAREGIVVVIDPGHGGFGGTNEGGKFGQNVEKYLTLLTAQAMKETLEQFEGVTVYLTRTQDQEVSLVDRAAIADTYHADFMFSLHYNMKGEHNLYGTEVWTSAFSSDYEAGQTFAGIHLQAMQENYGLHNRGAKVRLDSKGKQDYYGVIRAAHQYRIPCVIIEHCYLDNPNDNYLVATPQQVANLGVTDALSVAKYFRLKSQSLGLDFTREAYAKVKAPVGGMAMPDMTAPVDAQILVTPADKEGNVTITLRAKEPESRLIYYSYSTDEGKTWSTLQKWQGSDTCSFVLKLPGDTTGLRCRIRNEYDLETETPTVKIP